MVLARKFICLSFSPEQSQIVLGNTIVYTCIEGHWASATHTREIVKTCGLSGNLESEEVCEPLLCDVPDDVANGVPATTEQVGGVGGARK